MCPLHPDVQELNVQISRKGKAIIHRSGSPVKSPVGPSASEPDEAEDGDKAPVKQLVWLQHDRVKQLPISPSEPHPFLQKLGMQTQEGKIK